MMNKITRSLMDIANKIKRYKIRLNSNISFSTSREHLHSENVLWKVQTKY